MDDKETQDKETESWAQIGYGCTCGFKTLNGKEFRSHVFLQSLKDGKGTHRSLGRVDMETGEVLLDPWNKRTLSQKRDTAQSLAKSETKRGGKQAAGGESKSQDGDHHWADDIPARGTSTKELDESQAIEYTPRILKADFTPIMRSARSAAIREWGWSPDMSWEDFVDTIFWLCFNDRDIVLTGYTVRSNNNNPREVT